MEQYDYSSESPVPASAAELQTEALTAETKPAVAYLTSRTFRQLLTWFHVIGIINIVVFVFSAIAGLISLFNGGGFVTLISLAINGFSTYLVARIGKGAKLIKNGNAAGGDEINKSLSVYHGLIIVGYVLTGLLTLLLLIGNKFSSGLTFITPLLLCIPLYFARRYYEGIQQLVDRICLDMSYPHDSEYENKHHVTGISYAICILNLLLAIIFSFSYSQFRYHASTTPLLELILPFCFISSIPAFLIAKVNNFVKRAHTPNESYDSLKKETALPKHRMVSLFASAFCFSLGLIHLNNLKVYLLYLDIFPFVNSIDIAFSIVYVLAYAAFGIALLIRKRNHLFFCASALLFLTSGYRFAENLYSVFNSHSHLSFIDIGYNFILPLLDIAVWGALAFFALRTIKGKKDLPDITRIILCVIAVISPLCSMIINLTSYMTFRYIKLSTVIILVFRNLFPLIVSTLIPLNTGRYSE